MEPQNVPSRYDDRPAQPAPNNAGNLPNMASVPPPGVMPGQAYPVYPTAAPTTRVVTRRRFRVTCLGCAVGVMGLVAVASCGMFVIISIVWNSFNRTLGERLEQIVPEQERAFQTTRIFDRDGNELYQVFAEGRRTRVRLSEIAPAMITATIAVEDDSFFENPGIDVASLTRAGLSYFSGSEAGGASTITQQLVRNIAFDYEYRTERSARRKIEEILLSVVMTQQYSKDAILEMYLNTIYYGNMAYGIEAAAQTYFDKNARDLTLAESALLAGIVQSPSVLDPLNPDLDVQDAVFDRQRLVLDLMVGDGKITSQQASAAREETLIFADPNIALLSPHFTLYAQDELAARFPDAVQRGGLQVYTTLAPDIQAMAERVAAQQIEMIRAEHNANNAAVVVLHPVTGEILALLGSVDYNNEAIDGRVDIATSPRQPGSSIKPLMYAAALERGFSAATILWDVETHIGEPSGEYYSPGNYDRSWHGPVRVRTALANSYNIPAVVMLRQIGVDTLLEYAERVGIRSLGRDASRFGLALTLGGGEITPLEMANAYAVFANSGRYVPATAIRCVLDSDNLILYEYESGCEGRGEQVAQGTYVSRNDTPGSRQVLDERIAFVISDMLADNEARSSAMGARSPLRTDGIVSSVKTGTTDNYRDNWTIGYTHNVVVAVWVGNADNTEMQRTTGLTGAAPIWNQIITGLYGSPDLLGLLQRDGGLRPDELTPPGGVSRQPICDLHSVREPNMSPECAPGGSEWMLETPPLVPDETGMLIPAPWISAVPTMPAANGPLIETLDPGIVRAMVFPINPALAVTMSTEATGYGGVVPPPQQYCLVPQEVAGQIGGSMVQTFIRRPAFPDEDIFARLYAQAAGLAIEPVFSCNQEILAAGPYASGVTAVITSPRPNDTTSGTVYVDGSVVWQPGGAWYFKLEIIGPQFSNWTTFSGPIEIPVINGPLGNFGGAGLVPGVYQIRIVVVGVDGNHLMEGPPVPINVTGA